MAWRSVGMPGSGAYWLCPARSASTAASTMGDGPSSSGKPCPRLMAPVRSASAVISVKMVVGALTPRSDYAAATGAKDAISSASRPGWSSGTNVRPSSISTSRASGNTSRQAAGEVDLEEAVAVAPHQQHRALERPQPARPRPAARPGRRPCTNAAVSRRTPGVGQAGLHPATRLVGIEVAGPACRSRPASDGRPSTRIGAISARIAPALAERLEQRVERRRREVARTRRSW